MQDKTPPPVSVEDITAQVEQDEQLSEGLKAGRPEALVEFFEQAGVKVSSYSVRQLA